MSYSFEFIDGDGTAGRAEQIGFYNVSTTPTGINCSINFIVHRTYNLVCSNFDFETQDQYQVFVLVSDNAPYPFQKTTR